MGSPGDDAHVVEHLQALSAGSYQREKIQREIDETLEMAATSAPTNKILLKELQKLRTSFEGYNQYIDNHVEKAMEYIEKTPMTERAKKRRDVQNESLIKTYMKTPDPSGPEGFTRASSIKKNE